MKYDFDAIIDRNGTGSMKWDRNHKFEELNGRNVNSLWVADMDFECAPPIVEALMQRAAHPVYGYTYFDGSGFFEAVRSWNSRRYGWEVNTDAILYSPGVVYSVAAAINAFTEPGEGVIIQTPVYYPFKKRIESNGRRVVENPLVIEDGRYVMDYDDLEKAASADDVKMMILCSPHNPVGRVWDEGELKKVADCCAENGVLLISDEIHADILRDGVGFIPAAKACGCENIVTVSAPSKTFNIPGLMVSYAMISDENLRQKWKTEAYGRNGMSLPNPMGITAAVAAYNDSEEWLNQLNEYIDTNLEWMKSYIAENMPEVKYDIPEGTYLAWLDFRDAGYPDDSEFSDILDSRLGILVDPGYIFGAQGRGFIRINAACPKARLEDALAKIKSIL